MSVYNIVFVISIVLCAVRCDLDLPEGAKCITGGYNGTCVPMFRCGSASLTYIHRKQGYTSDVAEFPDVCSQTDKETEPIVCCTDCKILDKDEFRNAVISPSGQLEIITGGPMARRKCYDYYTTLPYNCRGFANAAIVKDYVEAEMCHKYNLFHRSHVLSGRDAQRWEFPHMALLGYGNTQETAQWLCGGSIISERFILTAGHCVYSTIVGNVSFAALGLLKRTDPPQYWKVYKIKRAITYPEYKPPSKYHDIALLETENEIAFGRDVLPACVFSHLEDYPAAAASGWGSLGAMKGIADVLQVVTLREIDERTCLSEYPPHRLMKNGFNVTTQMCYGSRDKLADTCQGDSGGPLQTDELKCYYTVEGVTSIGKECGKLGSPGLYTRVKFYVPWIESIVWLDE